MLFFKKVGVKLGLQRLAAGTAAAHFSAALVAG